MTPCEDIDQEDWGTINKWMDDVTSSLSALSIESRQDYLVIERFEEGYNRNKPFMARLKVGHALCPVEQ